MTLCISLIGWEGVYQSTDHRLTMAGKAYRQESLKHIYVKTQHSCCLVSYIGAGHTRSGAETVQWLRNSAAVRSHTVPSLLANLASEAAKAYERVTPHVAFVIVGRAPESYFHAVVTNGRAGGRIAKDFDIAYSENGMITNQNYTFKPDVFAAGSGVRFISDDDWRLMNECVRTRPRSPIDYVDLLAAVNIRTARRARLSGNETVSEWSHGAFVETTCRMVYAKSFYPLLTPRNVLPVMSFIVEGKDDSRKIDLALDDVTARITEPATSHILMAATTPEARQTMDGWPNRHGSRLFLRV